MLIGWKTTMLPLGADSAHRCVSVIYGSGFDSECVGHLKPAHIPLLKHGVHHGCRYESGKDESSWSDSYLFQGDGRWNIFLRGRRELKRQTTIKLPLLIVFFRLRCSLSGLDWFFQSKADCPQTGQALTSTLEHHFKDWKLVQRTHACVLFFFSPLLQNSNATTTLTDWLVARQQEYVSSYLIFDGSKKSIV